MSAERRVHKRYDLHLSAEVNTGEREFTAVTRDVSAGGCCVESAYRLEEGAHVKMSLFVVVDGIEDTSMAPLQVASRVQWAVENEEAAAVARHLAGVKFEGATDQQTAWLEGVLTRMG
jgi:hypothetical protein